MMQNKTRLVVIVSVILCTCALVYALISYRYFFHDDELISLRYIRNFSDHKGLNWNPGERVEGYTSFLHLIFSAFFIWLTGDFLLAPRIVNFIFFGLLLFTASRLFRRRFPCNEENRNLLFILFLLIVIPYPGIVIWIYGGLETVTYTSILFIALCCFLYLPRTSQNSIWGGLLFAVTTMTRPDGLLFFVICTTCLFLVNLKVKKWRVFYTFILSFLVPFGFYFLCRYSYYGLLLPNTFYAKTSFNLSKIHIGLKYTARFAASILFIILAIGFLFWQNKMNRFMNTRVRLLLGSIFLYTCYVTVYGGDHMPGFRYFIPLIPLIALLCAELSARLPTRLVLTATLFLIADIFFICFYNPPEFNDAKETDTAAFNGASIGNYLNSTMKKSQLIATHSAGAIPFFAYHHRFIDMLGLCDTTISHRKIVPMLAPWQHVPGHEKGDGSYVLSRHPDIIILGPSQGTVSNIWFLSDAELINNPLFKKNYQLHQVRIPANVLKLNSQVVFSQKPAGDSLTFTYYKRIENR